MHPMSLNFSTQWNSIRRRNRHWKAALEPGSWISLHFHSSRFQNQARRLTLTNEGLWFSFHKKHKLGPILSSARNILLAIQHFHTYSFATITSNDTDTSPSVLRAETSSRFEYNPPENRIWHTDDRFLSQKEKAIFFLCRSSFSEWVQRSPK